MFSLIVSSSLIYGSKEERKKKRRSWYAINTRFGIHSLLARCCSQSQIACGVLLAHTEEWFSAKRNSIYILANQTRPTVGYSASYSSAQQRFIIKWHWGAIPPVQVKPSGLKSACSTSRMRSRYSRIFAFSAILNNCAGFK